MLGARRAASSKSLPQVRLALAVELVDDLRAVDREEVGLGFMGDGAGEQGLAAARRAVRSTPFGASIPSRSNSSGYFSGNSTISRTRSSCRFSPPMSSYDSGSPAAGAGDSAGLDLQQRVRADQHGARGPGALHKEVGAAVAEKRRPHAIAGDNGQAVQQAADVFQIAARRRAALGNQQQLLRGANGSAANRGEFVQPDAGVLADHAVDLQVLLAAVLLEGRQRTANGLPLALHLDHLADVHAEPLHVGGVDPRDAAADVAAGRFADAQGDVGGQNG